MYKLLLCWRYLRTRYIALVCIISVMLGVATMIVVNSVMAGYSSYVEGQVNAAMGDIVLGVRSLDGAPDPTRHMERINRVAGKAIAGMTPTVMVPSLLYMEVGGQLHVRQVMLVGVDEATFASVSNMCQCLQHPFNRKRLSFDLREAGYDTKSAYVDSVNDPRQYDGLGQAGWQYRRRKAEAQRQLREMQARNAALAMPIRGDSSTNAAPTTDPFNDPFKSSAGPSTKSEGGDFDAATKQHQGMILAVQDCSYRDADGKTHFVNLPGDDVRVSFPKASLPPDAISEFYTIADVYHDPIHMGEESMAFVPLRHLQHSRGLVNPETGVGNFNSIHIKLKPHADLNLVRDALRREFDPQYYVVNTWQDLQSGLLQAIWMETVLLNILLFLIVAVAGFGILAIFSMIVVEKTRDIGILKSLGASRQGVMGIFLCYGLCLGLVGSGVGTALGLAFSTHINDVKKVVEQIIHKPVFDPSVYFMDRIPTIIDYRTVAWIIAGSVLIAVAASVLPARRAARLHPVQALRYE